MPKISNLPAASGLNITDTVPIVQSGVTSKSTVTDWFTAVLGYIQSGVGAAYRTLQARLRDVVSVKDFGAVGDGVTDDTAAIVAAMAAHTSVFFPTGTYIFSNSTFAAGARIYGSGKGTTVIKWKASSAEAGLFAFSGTGIRVEFENLTIDGNKANQTDSTGYYGAVQVVGGGNTVVLNSVRFINGRIQDVVVRNATSTVTYFSMTGCEFSDGLEGTLTRAASYVQAQDNVICTWIGNRATMPSGGTVGRAGFLHQRPEPGVVNAFGKLIAHGNHFENVGRGGTASDTLGCIDAYSGCDLISIQGNTSKGSFGRFIDVKADNGDCVIAGNTCIDHEGDVAAIVFFDQEATYFATSVGRNLVIANNIVRNTTSAAGGKGIYVDGDDTNSASDFANVLIQGNICDDVSQYGIYVRNVTNVSILGNSVATSARGIFIDSLSGVVNIKGNSFKDLTNNGVVFSGAGVSGADAIIQDNTFDNCDSIAIGLFSSVNSFVIKGNVVRGCTTFLQTVGAIAQSAVTENDVQGETTTWAKTGTYGLLEYRNNITTVGPTFTVRTLTIAAGVVTAFADFHVIDTEGAAATDDLDTINGGYDGRVLTVYAANGARDVVLKDATGNLQLSGDCTLNNDKDSITLMFRSSNWCELSRSDNGA